MGTPMTYKAMFQGSLLDNLPAELKYCILDYLDGTSLKKCRLLSRTYLEMINNCEKYNKHWVLDISNIPIDSNQEIVRIFSNSNMNFGRLVGITDKFVWNKKLFGKLGKTVTHIKDIWFYNMNRRTTKIFVETFDKVTDLKLCDTTLLSRMQEMGLSWPSVKRLKILCGGRKKRNYTGNFSEFPNVEEITLQYFNMVPEHFMQMIKVCPEKITGIMDKMLFFPLYDPFPQLCSIENLALKHIKVRYAARDEHDEFLMAQTGITKYEFYAKLSRSMDYYHTDKLLPDFIDLTHIHSLTLEMRCETELDLRLLDHMPNLRKFGVVLYPGFRHYRSEEEKTCFLMRHTVQLNSRVTHLSFDPRGLSDVCQKCLRTFLSSFTHMRDLRMGEMSFCSTKEFQQFWRMVNSVLKKTGVAQHLSMFRIDVGDHRIIIDCEEYKLFKAMTFLPQLKTLELQICLTKVTRNTLKTLCDKCPGLKRLDLGTGHDIDLHLSGFLIHQLKYLKHLKISDQSDLEEREEDLAAKADLIGILMNVPLKLWTFETPFDCKAEELFPLFEKFPILRQLHVNVKQDEDVYIHSVFRNEYYGRTN